DPARADPGLAFSLAKLAETPAGPTPIGIFRDVQRPTFSRAATEPPSAEQMAELLSAGDTWTVG
ncbi:MAG: 2-oxoacid:ferredoxin oxidoreductase subunit beta, partial [Solirubrobacteraceae bacterium]